MGRVHIQTPGAISMDQAIKETFAGFGLRPMGGQSTDGWSKIADLQRCEYRYYLRYEVGAPFLSLGGVEVAGAESYLEVGGLFHAALAVHYASLLPPGSPSWQANVPSPLDFIDAVESFGPELGHVVRARQLLYGYLEHYNPDEIEPLAIEVEAGIPGVHTSRYDLIARYQKGIVIGEHKSAYRESEETIERWYLDGEIVGEVMSWHMGGLDKVYGPLTGVLINLAFKTAVPTFRRLVVPISRQVVEWYAEDRKHWGEVRDHYRRINYWPRKLTGCFAYNSYCGYRAHCRDGSPTLFEIRRKAEEASR